MHCTIESLCILPHQDNIIHKLIPTLVVVPLCLVAHVLQSDWIRNEVLVGWSILPGHLIDEELELVFVLHLLDHFEEDVVECLITGLLAFPLTLVIELIAAEFEVVVAEAM